MSDPVTTPVRFRIVWVNDEPHFALDTLIATLNAMSGGDAPIKGAFIDAVELQFRRAADNALRGSDE